MLKAADTANTNKPRSSWKTERFEVLNGIDGVADILSFVSMAISAADNTAMGENCALGAMHVLDGAADKLRKIVNTLSEIDA